jgi:RHS repeat-associated protein
MRNPSTWQYNALPTNPLWLYRGYTGHEHLALFGLINMNGRMYDPVIGRVLSVDNYTHGGSQGYNRYAYALNNPLKFTDPDGENPLLILAAVGAAVGTISGGWQGYQIARSKGAGFGSSLAYVAAGAGIGAISGAAGGLVAGIGGGSAGGGAVGGAIGGAGFALLNGGSGYDAFVGGVTGGISGAVGGGIAGRGGPGFAILGGAVGGGINAALNGASVGNVAGAMFFGAAGGAVGYGIGKAASSRITQKNEGDPKSSGRPVPGEDKPNWSEEGEVQGYFFSEQNGSATGSGGSGGTRRTTAKLIQDSDLVNPYKDGTQNTIDHVIAQHGVNSTATMSPGVVG